MSSEIQVADGNDSSLVFAGALLAGPCLWSLGFNPEQAHGRQCIHSLLGCCFYGAFVAKVLVVRSHRMPGWAIPVIGELLFTTLILLWLTSAFWFFRNFGVDI